MKKYIAFLLCLLIILSLTDYRDGLKVMATYMSLTTSATRQNIPLR